MKLYSTLSKELIAYLLLHPQAGLAKLMPDVFPKFTSDNASYYAHTCLYRIRKSLKECGLGQEITIDYRTKRYETTVAVNVPNRTI
jgi:two-component SAPR family response regulator